MHIGIAADHAGLVLKEKLIKKLRKSGHDVQDFGPFSLAPEDDYPNHPIYVNLVSAGKRDLQLSNSQSRSLRNVWTLSHLSSCQMKKQSSLFVVCGE